VTNSARLCLALGLSAWLAGCATPSAVGPIEHRIGGSGKPIVVLQSGLGDGLAVWDALQARLDPSITSFAYSRPGYGRSPWVDGERSPCEVAREERALLQASGFNPPYLLVGHSLGGLYQYAFAKLYPQDVAGLVLLDPTHPQQWATLQRDAPAFATMLKLMRARFSAAMRSEFDDQARCLERLQPLPMPKIPVRWLVRGRFSGLEAGAFADVIHGLEADWSRLLDGVSPQTVANSGHYIQRDHPDSVREAIDAVVASGMQRR
jgi:pimeloyl-ACP methyl ester carboxylesterase